MNQSSTAPGGVARIWRGRTSSTLADEYTRYLYDHGVKKLESLGARGVQMLREDQADSSFFMVTSFWDSMEAMTRWAGADPTRIRHLDKDPEYLLELPSSVQILSVVSCNWILADTMRI
ncbi:hypothetical protein SAMN04515666_103300 [Bosea lupini]|jgi:heme-degrading monooxygenase HmoA|uniref:Antibiotic biosynthesis monooxygenase n=1 Tax=Bosea lupini TaxID=1036779 RepID=A0A1H7NZD8_9HYPH|nr:hypothetical protein [Bosea lupini]SEL28365.1 hypothetical protein SAMN04515666_103300 [Bosea lupini]